MKQFLTIFLILFFWVTGQAQVKYVARTEVPSNLYDTPFEMMRLEEGIAAFRTIPEKGLSFKLVLQYIRLDFNLNSNDGLLEYPVRPGFDLIGYDYAEGDLYLLFQKGSSLNSEKYIFKIDSETNQGFEFNADNLLEFQLLEFLVENNKAIFMGDADGRPAVQIFDLEDKSVHTIQGIYGNDTQILQLQKLPEIDAIQVVISRKGQYRTREILINTYDLLGNLLREIRVDEFGEENQEILEGLLLPPFDYRQAMIGSFGLDRGDSYQGMYLMDINEFGEFDFKTYTLIDFPNFYNYLPEKLREKRIQEIIKRDEKGKTNNIRNVYTIRSVRNTDDAFYIYFDHLNVINSRGSIRPGFSQFGRYYRYDQFNRMGYSPFFDDAMGGVRYPNNPVAAQLTSEFQYISAHFIKLGKEGNVVWDNSSTYDDFSTTYPQPFGEMAVVGEDLYHVFVKNLTVKMSYFKKGEKVFENADFPIELINEEERIRETNANSIQLVHWYGPYFLMTGTQRIRFLDETNKEQTREVFFITKILVDGDLYESSESVD